MKKTGLPFIVLLFVCDVLLAQNGEIVFTKFTREKGLASSRITRMIQDHQGFYWISSFNGLQRYDGSRMISFQHHPGDSSSLPYNSVGVLMEDNQNRLWLNSGGVPCIYDPLHRNFIKIPIDFRGKETFSIHSFFQDSKGSIWMAATGDDLFVLDTIHNIFRSHSSVWPKCPAIITSIAQDKKSGYYWLNTNKGIMTYDPRQKQYYSNSNNPLGWQCFKEPALAMTPYDPYIDDNDIIWMQVWDPSKGYFHFRYDIKKDSLTSINMTHGTHLWGFINDATGTLWCYGDILGHYDEPTNSFIKIPSKKDSQHGIDFNEIFSMSRDKENNLWVMSNLGSYSFHPGQQSFTTYSSIRSNFSKQPVDANTNAFIETNDGHIIALSWGGDGLYFYDTAFNPVPFLYGYSRSATKGGDFFLTWCGLQDSRGMIWIGCQNASVMQLDPFTNKVNQFTSPEFEGRTIRSIAEDKNGNIWFGTQRNVIVKWNRRSNTYKQIVPLSGEKYTLGWVLRILPGNKNDLWVITGLGGMLHIDCDNDSIIEQFMPDKKDPASISSADVRDAVSLNADTLVLVTGVGIDLFVLSSKSFIHITPKDGLPGEGIFAVVKDVKNNLWFSSVDGISKIQLPDKRIHNYGAADGITELDFQPLSATRFKNNRIAFGNTRGFVSFHPDAVNETYVPPDVLITGFRIFDRDLSVDSMFLPGNKIRLTYSQNYITIQFASIGNIVRNRPEYYYMLEGIDKNWIKAGEALEANYTYLPDGDYTFKIRCVSMDGIQSRNITSFKIHISPPFWKTWWFILLTLAVVGSVLFYIYLLRIRRKNEREMIRNRIARDLHDDMGSTLSTINILSSMAKSKLHTDEIKTSEYINKIGDNSQRMMEAMDDIVWAIKPDNDSMQKIIARMREFSTSVLEAKDIELDFTVDEKVNGVKLDMEARRDLFLLFKEAINNAAKYSRCEKCAVHIAVHRHRLILDIRDNGAGFDVSKADSGNGLSNMRKRADSLKGRLQVQSQEGKGTQVTLNIPVT